MKKSFKIGALIGGGVGISIALSMDLIMGGTIGNGGWFQAVANDLNLLLKANYKQSDLIVIIGAIIVITIFVAISALIGGIFFNLISSFFDLMTKRRL